MKKINLSLHAIILCLLVSCVSTRAEDLRKIVSLSGTWRFSIGDDSKWSDPKFNDSDWDKVSVPSNWENQGYEDYNGYAWYRKTFTVDDLPSRTTLYLVLGRIDDVDVVYLNGVEIGSSGKFPPEYITAYNRDRKYIIPEGLLKQNGDNVVCIKVYDSTGEGGLVSGPTGICYDDDVRYLDMDLSGSWKFHTGNNKDWKTQEFDDSDWKKIAVPSTWENQGYEDYDGYAWYRTEFSLASGLSSGELYLSLGKIDDEDEVYLNGKKIGDVDDLRKYSFYRGDGWQYNTRRLYKIPADALNRNGRNILAVKVFDGQGLGGIYEGPIGIMTVDHYKKYKSTYNSGESFWEYMLDKFYHN
jgi:hypothetical protein